MKDLSYGLFLIFLSVAAIQDFRRKQVMIWVFVLFGIAALILDGYAWLSPGQSFSWKSHLESCCLGIVLLGAERLCRGEIGLGDGLFFLISGLMLGFSENLFLLCGSVMLCGIYCLAYFALNQVRGRDVRKTKVPFLPFALPPGIWLVQHCVNFSESIP